MKAVCYKGQLYLSQKNKNVIRRNCYESKEMSIGGCSNDLSGGDHPDRDVFYPAGR